MKKILWFFLVATKRLSVCLSVGTPVHPYVCHAFAFCPSRNVICRLQGLLFRMSNFFTTREKRKIRVQDRGGQQSVLKRLFHLPFFFILLVALSSLWLLPPRCSFLLIAPSSSLFLPSNCFFLHFISSRKVLTSSNLTKALWTDGPTDEQTRSLIETGGC